MQRRNLLIGMGSLAAGGAATIGTGAFTSVEATRTVTINAGGDTNAYLGMEPDIDTPNSDYASDGGAGSDTVSVDLSSINRNSETNISNIFEVRNNGTQPVYVYVDPDNGVSPAGVTVPLTNSEDSRNFPSLGSSGTNTYIDPQATDMPNEPDGFSLTGVYGSTIPESIAEYEGLGNIGDPDGSENIAGSMTGAALNDRRLNIGQSFKFGLNVQHQGSGDFPDDISVALKAVDREQLL